MIVRPQVPMWWLGDAVVVVAELDAVVVVVELRVPMRGQGVSVGWSWTTMRGRDAVVPKGGTCVIWLKVGNGVATGAE